MCFKYDKYKLYKFQTFLLIKCSLKRNAQPSDLIDCEQNALLNLKETINETFVLVQPRYKSFALQSFHRQQV